MDSFSIKPYRGERSPIVCGKNTTLDIRPKCVQVSSDYTFIVKFWDEATAMNREEEARVVYTSAIGRNMISDITISELANDPTVSVLEITSVGGDKTVVHAEGSIEIANIYKSLYDWLYN